MLPEPGICGVLLAGGQSRRMGGGDKCLRDLGARTLLPQPAAAAARARDERRPRPQIPAGSRTV